MSTIGSLGCNESPETFLSGLREHVRRSAPDILSTFDEYAGEALFGHELLEETLRQLPARAHILEIGAGALMLSCMLAREGYDVTAVEPVGDGFSHLSKLQRVVLEYANEHGAQPKLIRAPGEDLSVKNQFDYAFSVNVMEHVGDVARVLENVYASLKPGGTYRFICPNYAFPYEPHFNLPTLFSRKLTERVMSRHIMASKKVVDPAGTWASLNWITVGKVRRVCRTRLQTAPQFDRRIVDIYLTRMLSGGRFSERRGPLFARMLSILTWLRVTALAGLIPVRWLPLMDCRVVRR
ncbi:class I SAM-dependent methyltransferase [Trinickia sp.]|uniref:class I SAM-dependent methyltransferase n=1 Tax=Trinickia sp. TaxID=2571163 RepID=UPI003F7FE93A